MFNDEIDMRSLHLNDAVHLLYLLMGFRVNIQESVVIIVLFMDLDNLSRLKNKATYNVAVRIPQPRACPGVFSSCRLSSGQVLVHKIPVDKMI